MSTTNAFRELDAYEQSIWSDAYILFASHLPQSVSASAEADFAIQRLRMREDGTHSPQELRLWVSVYAAALVVDYPWESQRKEDSEQRDEAEKHADDAVKALRSRSPLKAQGQVQVDFESPENDPKAVIPKKVGRPRPGYSAELARIFLTSEIKEYPQNYAASREGLYHRVMTVLAQAGDVGEDGTLFPLRTGRDPHRAQVLDPLGKPTKEFASGLVEEALTRLERLEP
jgi:hypothetical protein